MVSSPSWSDLYPAVFKLIGLEKYIGDPMLHERDAARENYDRVCALITDSWKQFTTDELMKLFSENGLVCSKILGPNDIYDDEQAWANDYLTKITLENGDDLVVPRVPIQFGSEEAPAKQHLAPALGSDTADVFRSLGYSEDQIAAITGK